MFSVLIRKNTKWEVPSVSSSRGFSGWLKLGWILNPDSFPLFDLYQLSQRLLAQLIPSPEQIYLLILSAEQEFPFKEMELRR